MVRSIALISLASAVLLGTASTALADAPSFALWWGRFSARVQRDIQHIDTACQARFGHDDAKVGACFVKAERASLRAESASLTRQLATISRGQKASCRKAITIYGRASRRAATANLRYLDAHPHITVSRLARELNRAPYTKLKSATFAARSRAIRTCG